MGKSSNLPAKMYSAGERSVTRLSFEGSGNSTQFIDIGLALSAVNQRHYRSGLYYYVASVEVYNNEDALIDILTLPDTYAIKNAWNRGFDHYMKNMAVASETPRGQWHDFRVYMSDLHRTTGSLPPSLHTINAGSAAVTIDETNLYSQLISADDDGDASQDADNFNLHMLGPHVGSSSDWTSVGLVMSYDAAKQDWSGAGEPTFDNTEQSTDPLINLFDYSSEDQMNDVVDYLESNNDIPPYDRDTLVGAASVTSMLQVGRLATVNNVGRVARISGFPVPYGLICVDPSGTSSAYRVVVNLVPGTYHGVYAERSI